jgi:phage portal protein BeeE
VSWWDRWVWSRVRNREALTLEQLLADQGTPTAAGEAVTTDSAMRLSTVWGCVRLLSDSVSTLPLDVYRRGEGEPLATTPPLLAQPSADFELADWLYAVMASLLLRGNAYGLVTARAGAGMLPAQVDLVHPDRMACTIEDGRRVYRLAGEEQDPADVWHVRAYVFPGRRSGCHRSPTPARPSAWAWAPRSTPPGSSATRPSPRASSPPSSASPESRPRS